METVLVVGATGNIGVSAVTAALRSKRNVLAIVRNQNSADNSSSILGRPRASLLLKPMFSRTRGSKVLLIKCERASSPLSSMCIPALAANTRQPPSRRSPPASYAPASTPPSKPTFAGPSNPLVNPILVTNGLAVTYRDSIGSLLEQNNPASTLTICTGAQGDFAIYPVPAMAQGALFPMAKAAARENESTNVRFYEIYLGYRVEVDEVAAQHGTTKSSDFGKVYEMILANPEVRSSRVRVDDLEDLKKLKYQKKF